MEENKEIGKLSADEIATLKSANPRGVYQIIVHNNKSGTRHYGYFKKPGRQQLDFASSEASKGGKFSIDRFNSTLTNNCWVAGDESIKNDDDLFLSAATQFGELAKVFESEIKEL